jgi:hypothetical protein
MKIKRNKINIEISLLATTVIPYNGLGAKAYILGVIGKTIDVLLGFAGALAALFIIISGIQMIASAGNTERQANAKKTLTYAVYGIIIVILSYAILYLIKGSLTSMVNG